MPILGTTGNVTKADGGLAAFGTTQLYTGQTNINGGTLQLASVSSQILYVPPTTGNAPNTYTNALEPVAISMMVNNGGVLDLNGGTQTVVNLTNLTNAVNTAQLPLTGGTVTNSSSTAATLSILQGGNSVWFGGSITGNLNLIRAGGWTYNLESPNTYYGTTTTLGGDLNLIDLGTLQNTSAIYLNGGSLWWNDTGTQAVIQRIPTSAAINMNAGAFNYSARNGTQGAISVGTINLLSGASIVNVVPNNGGATLTINNTGGTIQRNTGATVNFTGTNSDGIGDAAHVYFQTGLSTTGGLVGAWATANQIDEGSGIFEPGFATYTSADGIGNINANLVTIATGAVPAGVNARMNGNVTLPAGGATLNTLSILNAGVTLSFAASTDRLTLTAGGILGGFDSNTRTLGQSANFGQITVAAGQPELFIYSGGTNAMVINSSIVDNGSNMSVVVGNLNSGNTAGAVTLAGTNSFGGTTYVNGPLNLNAPGAAIPHNLVAMTQVVTMDSSYYAITFNNSNQIAATGSVTLNGGTVLNLNNYSNTINNLTLNNISGDQNFTPATVLTGIGVLTVSGSVNVAANTNTFFVPVVNGNLTLGNTSNPTINVIPNAMAPQQIGLQLNSALTLSAATSTPLTITGGGILAIGGESQYANPTSVAAGTTLAFGTAGAEIGNSQVVLPLGATLDARGVTGTIASLTGSGTVTNYNATTAGTLVTGLDNSSTTFAGTFTNAFATGLLNVTKIGSGNFNLSANNLGTGLNSPNLGTLAVSGGSVTLNTATAVEGFTGYTLNAGGTLVVDDSVNAVNNRLGGSYQLVSASVASPTSTPRTITFQGGNLNVTGNSLAAVSENLGNITLSNGGGSVLTLAATNTPGVYMAINGALSLAAVTSTTLVNNAAVSYGNSPATLLIRGDNLGTSSGTTANTATIVMPSAANWTAPSVVSEIQYVNAATVNLSQGGGTNGTVTMSIRPDILVDPSSTGSGTSFAVRDSASGLIRPLAASEYATSVGTLTSTAGNLLSVNNYVTNALFSTAQSIVNPLYLNSLTLSGTGSLAPSMPNSGISNLLFLNSAGLLAASGTTTISTPITTGGDITDVHVAGAGTVLNINGPFISTTAGIVKADAGTLIFNTPQYNTGTMINGGVLRLSAGNNTLLVQPGATTPTLAALGVSGGTIDLNGNSQAVGNLSNANLLPGGGGTITNASLATAATLIVNPVANSTFAGSITSTAGAAALTFDKQGANTLLLTGSESATTTNIQGGTLTLRDGGAITAGTVNVNYATLNIDNTGLLDGQNRLGTVPVNMNGGALTVTGRQAFETVNLPAVTANQGASSITINPTLIGGTNSGITSLQLANLAQTPGSGATINFANGTGLTVGQVNNPMIFITGSGSATTNGILGGWAIYNGTDFAGYGANGVVATGYSQTNNLSTSAGTDNVQLNATLANATGGTINSVAIRSPGAQSWINLNTAASVLDVGTGGFLINDSNNKSVSFAGGQVTAGTSSAPAALYTYVNTTTGVETVFSQFANNPAGGVVSLVKAGGGALTLNSELTMTSPSGWAIGAGTLSVPSAAGLFVGETIPAASGLSGTITAISGNVLTLSNTATAAGGANSNWIQFSPAVLTTSTTAGSNQVTLTLASTQGWTTGMAIGGAGIPAGTTIMAISGTGACTLTLSNSATATNSAASLSYGAQSNNYTGNTIVNQGTLNLSGQVGSVVVPGNLTINNAAVTMTGIAGQIAPTSTVTLNSGGVLTLTGSNVLNSAILGGIGGTNQTSLNIGGGLLTLSASNAVTAQNDNTGMTPQITGGNLAFTNAAATINASGLSTNSLVISAPIVSSNGALTIAGSGAVTLSGSSTFSSGLNLQGTVILAADSTPNTIGAAVTSGPLGSGTLTANGGTILSGTGNQNISNAVTINSTLNFGGTVPANNVTLNGPVTLGSGSAVNVNSPLVTATINGLLSGSSLIKNGPGTLFVSNSGNSPNDVTINNGTLGAYALTGSGAFGTPLGAGTVTLNGGRLTLQGQFQNQGLWCQVYNGPNAAANLNNLSALQAMPGSNTVSASGSTTTSGKTNLDFSNSGYGGNPMFSVSGATTLALGDTATTNYTSVMSGYIYLPTPGQYTFQTTSDDGSALWIDGQNTAVVNSNVAQGATGRSGIYENTAPGWHQISVGYYQIGGGAGLLVQYTTPYGTLQTIPDSVLAYTPSASQTYGNNVNVTANSIIDVRASLNASMGSLSIGGNTLILTGDSGANLTLGPVALSGAPTFSPNAGTALTLGALNDSGTAQTITTANGGTVALNQAATSLINGTLFNVTGGTLNPTAAGAMGTLAQVNVASGGVLSLGAAQTIGLLTNSGSAGGNVFLNGNALTVGSAYNLSSTFAGTIADGSAPGTLVKAGTGNLTLAGANTYSGTTSVNNGVLSLANSAALGASSVTFGGGTLQFTTSNTQDYSFKIVNSTKPMVLDTNGQNVSFGSGLASSNTAGLTKLGGGTLALNTQQNYAGPTLISGGVVKLAGGGLPSLGGIAPALWLDASKTSSLVVNGSGKVTAWDDLSGNGYNATLDGTYNTPASVNSSNTAFNKMQTLTFAGNTAYDIPTAQMQAIMNNKSYTIFAVEGVNATGNQYFLGTNTTGVNNEGLHFGYRNTGDYTFAQYGNDIDYTGAPSWAPTMGPCPSYTGSEVGREWTAQFNSASGHYLWYNGSLTAAASSTSTTPLTVVSNGIVGTGFAYNARFNGDLGEILIYPSALSAGNIQAVDNYLMAKWEGVGGSGGNLNLLPVSTALSIATGSTLDLGGGSQQVASLADAAAGFGGSIINSGTTTSILTLNSTGGSTTFSGLIQGTSGTTGSIGLVMSGSGTQVLAGANTYNGGTTVAGGMLQLANLNALGTGGLTTTGGVLDLHGFSLTVGNSNALPSLSGTGGTITDNSTAGSTTLTVQQSGSTTYSGALLDGASTSIALVTAGAGTLTLAGSNGYSGGTTVSGGILQVGNSAALGNAAVPGIGAYPLTVATGGTLDLHGYNPTVGALTGNASGLITNLAGSTTSTLTTNTATATTFAGTIWNNGSMINLVKTGTGSLALTGTSTYSGTTSINQGTLQFTSMAALGNPSAGNGTINLGGGATLQFIGAHANTTRAINLTGNAAIDASGPNQSDVFQLSGTANSVTYTGGSGDNLTLQGSSAVGGVVHTAMNLGNGSLTKAGSGTWELDAANTYSGGTIINAGTLVLGNPNGGLALGSGPVNITGGTLDASLLAATVGSTFTVGSAGALNLTVGSPLTINGSASLGGTLNLLGVTLSTGTKDLMNYSSEVGSFTSFTGVLSPTYTLAYTSNQLDLVYATTATSYSLAATATNLNMRVNGSNTITAAIANTGGNLADTLNFTGLTLSPTGGLSGLNPTSGGPLALGGGSATSGTFTAATAGSYSFTASVASATNATIGNTPNAPVLTSTTPVTVGVYDYAHPSYTAGVVSFGNVRVGGTATESLAISNSTVTSASFQDNLNVAATTSNVAVTATGFTGEGAGTAAQNVVFTASTGTAGSLAGTVTLSLTSAPIASGLNPQTWTDTTSITTTGGVYRYAAGSLDTTSINLGTVHAGYSSGSKSYAVAITNSAANDGYSDQLAVNLGSFSGSGATLVSTGNTSAVNTGAGSQRGATITLSTASAGFINGSYNGSLISSPTATGLNTGHVVGSGVLNVAGTVYSGQMTWNLNNGTGGSWGISASNGSNWNDSNDTSKMVHAAPGVDANYTATDSATFDATTSGGTITLDNARPQSRRHHFQQLQCELYHRPGPGRHADLERQQQQHPYQQHFGHGHRGDQRHADH